MKSLNTYPSHHNSQSFREFLAFPTGTEKFVTGNFKKMGLIAGSCFAIALAGLLSRASFTTGDVASDVVAAVNPATDLTLAPMVARPFEPAKAESVLPEAGTATPVVSKEAHFARKQLALYSTLLDTLQARMNEEQNSDHLVRMRAAVTSLDQHLQQSQDSLMIYENQKASADTFVKATARETLKGNLFALQESGQRAVSVFVDADNFPFDDSNDKTLHGFRVSRSGR